MLATTSIFMAAILCGCSYHGQLKQAALSDKQVISKTAAKINLLNRKEDIKNISFKVGVGTFNYDIKEVFFNALTNTLNSIYEQVETGSKANPTSQFIAIPYFEATYPGNGIDTTSRIDILDGITKNLIKSYQAKKHIDLLDPPSTQALKLLTGITLFTTAPITIPIVINKRGDYWKNLLEKAISESLSNIKNELTRDEKINSEKAEIKDCFNKLSNEQSLIIITGKVTVDEKKRNSLDILANNSVPTESEKTAIKQWSNMRAECYALVNAFNVKAGVPASLLALYESTKTAEDNLLVMLYNGAITYGDFAQKRQDIRDDSVTAEAKIKEALAEQSAEAQAQANQLAIKAKQTNLAEIQTTEMQTQTQLMELQTINQSMQEQNQRTLEGVKKSV